jgi:hypothetical protein
MEHVVHSNLNPCSCTVVTHIWLRVNYIFAFFLGMVVHACNPSTLEAEASTRLGNQGASELVPPCLVWWKSRLETKRVLSAERVSFWHASLWIDIVASQFLSSIASSPILYRTTLRAENCLQENLPLQEPEDSPLGSVPSAWTLPVPDATVCKPRFSPWTRPPGLPP